jgi:hypothetical protein
VRSKMASGEEGAETYEGVEEEEKEEEEDDDEGEDEEESESSEAEEEGYEFFYAARRGDIDQVRTLLANGHHVNETDEVSIIPLVSSLLLLR